MTNEIDRFFEVIVGGSGRWVGCEIDATETRIGGGWVYSGHAPRVVGQRDIIVRQLARQATGVDPMPESPWNLGGGSKMIIKVGK